MPTSPLPPDFKPLNREPASHDLISHSLTSTTSAYDRNHGPIPHLSAATHTISISDTSVPPLLQTSTNLSFSSLRSLFPATHLTCALQCAGNRRHAMRTKLKEVHGIDWGEAAVMNCRWTGARLTDVLSHVLGRDVTKLSPSDLRGRHLAFACHATPVQDDDYYGSSLPLARALDPNAEILLAYEQNGERLTPEHGYPVRVVVPGIAGARSVKWLDSITIQDCESGNFYQQRDYKILPPEAVDVESAKEWWSKVPALMDMPINSVVLACGESKGDGGGEEKVEDGERCKISRDADGNVLVKGYALPGGTGGPVIKVEIRIDSGDWIEAEILSEQDRDANGNGDDGEQKPEISKWSWVLWRWKGPVEKGRHTIWSRATDRAGNRQERERSEWNLRGVAYNGYGEVDVEVL